MDTFVVLFTFSLMVSTDVEADLAILNMISA